MTPAPALTPAMRLLMVHALALHEALGTRTPRLADTHLDLRAPIVDGLVRRGMVALEDDADPSTGYLTRDGVETIRPYLDGLRARDRELAQADALEAGVRPGTWVLARTGHGGASLLRILRLDRFDPAGVVGVCGQVSLAEGIDPLTGRHIRYPLSFLRPVPLAVLARGSRTVELSVTDMPGEGHRLTSTHRADGRYQQTASVHDTLEATLEALDGIRDEHQRRGWTCTPAVSLVTLDRAGVHPRTLAVWPERGRLRVRVSHPGGPGRAHAFARLASFHDAITEELRAHQSLGWKTAQVLTTRD